MISSELLTTIAYAPSSLTLSSRCTIVGGFVWGIAQGAATPGRHGGQDGGSGGHDGEGLGDERVGWAL